MTVNQVAVPPLISHQWWPRFNLQHDHRMSENPWYTWWRTATGKKRDGISARPWHGYRIGPIWRRGGIRVICRWWSQLCPNHQWERWLGGGGWMKHAQLLSLFACTDAAWGFHDDGRRIQVGVLIRGDKRVEHSDIIVVPLKPSTPESTCHYVKSCTILDVSCCVGEGFTI